MTQIVVGTDGSDVSRYAVEWAAQEAQLRAQPLRIVHVLQRWLYDMPDDGPHAQIGRWARDDVGQLLEEAASHARGAAPQADVSTEIVPGDARPALIEASEGASLLVVGGRGEGGFAGLLLGSIAYGVVGRTRCPVVVVQGTLPETTGEVVTGVDGSPSSIAALEAAFAEAAARNATLRAVYARQADGSAEAIYGMRLDEEEARAQLSRAVVGPASRHPDVKVVEEVTEGHPVSALVKTAQHADLIVVGRRGRGGFAGLLLGSVSRGVLHHAQCPVMVVAE